MRKISLVGLAICFLLPAICSGQKQSASSNVVKYRAPDGAIVAVVASSQAPEATIESVVELRTKSGKLVTRRDYRSKDGEHGYGITKASWTPDSQFFVYSLESSGGHSAWHSPVQFFSRRRNKILSLDDALKDAVMNPQFVVAPPDKVTVELYFSRKEVTVSLASLK
jgi:hypothetical protein